MALQTPQIIGIQGNVISIKHPSLEGYTRTTLAADVAAAATALSVIDNLNFADTNHVIIGQLGVGGTESRTINAAVTRGQSLTVTPALTFDHPQDTQIINCQEAKIQIYSAATLTGSKTLVDTIDIQFASAETGYYVASTLANYYFVRFTNFAGTVVSSYSIGLPSAGYEERVASSIIYNALKSSNTAIDNELITWDFLIGSVNEAQQKVTQLASGDSAKKNWSFEISDLSIDSVLYVAKGQRWVDIDYLGLKYPTSNEPFISLTFYGKDLEPRTLIEIMAMPYPNQFAQVTLDTPAGSVSIPVGTTDGFPSSGTLYTAGQEITYTSKTDLTFDGIPAIGTGSITSPLVTGDELWTVQALGEPSAYAVSGGRLYLDRPYDGSHGDSLNLRGRYYKKLTPIYLLGQEVSAQFTNLFKDYVVGKIEYAKGNRDGALTVMNKFEEDIKDIIMNDTIETSKVSRYYVFNDTEFSKDRIWQTNF